MAFSCKQLINIISIFLPGILYYIYITLFLMYFWNLELGPKTVFFQLPSVQPLTKLGLWTLGLSNYLNLYPNNFSRCYTKVRIYRILTTENALQNNAMNTASISKFAEEAGCQIYSPTGSHITTDRSTEYSVSDVAKMWLDTFVWQL